MVMLGLVVMLVVGAVQVVSKQVSSDISSVNAGFGVSADQFYSQDFTTGLNEPMKLPGVSAPANELLVLFVGSDCYYCGETVSNVADTSGGLLTWHAVAQANGQPGDAEIWYAIAPSAINNISISVTRSSTAVPNWGALCYPWLTPGTYWGYSPANPDCNGMLALQTFSKYDPTTPLAAASTASGSGATESVNVNVTKIGSQIWGVGYDYEYAATRQTSQKLVHEDISAPDVDTAWVQNAGGITGALGNYVLTDTAPGAGPWDYAAVEVRSN
jgi:hypothetical protein